MYGTLGKQPRDIPECLLNQERKLRNYLIKMKAFTKIIIVITHSHISREFLEEMTRQQACLAADALVQRVKLGCQMYEIVRSKKYFTTIENKEDS